MKANDLLTANITLSRTQWALLEISLERVSALSSDFYHPVFTDIRGKIEGQLELLYEEEIAKLGLEELCICQEED